MTRRSLLRAALATTVLQPLTQAAPRGAPKPPPGSPPKPLYRDPIYDGAADPTLIWDRAGHRWVMFYTNRRANAQNLPGGVAWVHGTRIGMAASTDGGVTWKYL